MRLSVAVLTTFLRQIAVLALGLASISLISRALGVDEFGRYSYAFAALVVLHAIFSLSLSPVIVHFYESTRNTNLLGELLGNGLLIVFISTIILASTVFAIMYTGYSDRLAKNVDNASAMVFAVLLVLQMFTSFLEAVLLGARDYRAYNLLLLGNPLLLLLALVSLRGYYTTWHDVLLFSVGTYTLVLPFYWRSASKHGLKSLRIGSTIRITYMGYGLKIWVANIVTITHYRVPFFLIEALFGPAGLGQYALAAQFCEKLWVPGRSVAAILFPERSYQHSRRDLGGVFQQSIKIVAANALLVLVGIVCLFSVFSMYGEPLFGVGYEQVPGVVLALAPGIIAWSGVTIIGAELAGSGRSVSNLVASLAALVVGVVGLLGGAQFGLWYAVLGGSMGSVCGFVVAFRLFYKQCGSLT